MIHLQLVTLSGKHLDEDIFQVDVPTTAGTIAINGGHAPLLGAIAPGVLSVTRKRGDREAEELGVYDGTVEVLDNVARVLVDQIDNPEDISESEAQKAFEKARELKEKAGDAISIAEAQAAMDRQAVRLQLASLKKRSKKR
jgi:F-type H+-transporting ATPase subunit epsilon